MSPTVADYERHQRYTWANAKPGTHYMGRLIIGRQLRPYYLAVHLASALPDARLSSDSATTWAVSVPAPHPNCICPPSGVPICLRCTNGPHESLETPR